MTSSSLDDACYQIGGNGRIKVCDFGLARTSPTQKDQYITTGAVPPPTMISATLAHLPVSLCTLVGTNEWMAPEVAMQDPYDKSADVFSYAMVLYELITRDKPPPRKLKDAYAWDAQKMKQSIPDVISFCLLVAAALFLNGVPLLQDTPDLIWKLLCDCASFEPPKRPEFKEVAKRLKALLDTMPKEEDDLGRDPSDDNVDYADEPVPEPNESSDSDNEEETIETTR